MGPRDRRLLLLLAAVSGLWLLSQSFAGTGDLGLFLMPALLVTVPLLAGRYIGEEKIARLARRLRTRPRLRPIARPSAPRLAVVPARTGRLIAFALAVRPPPGPALSR